MSRCELCEEHFKTIDPSVVADMEFLEFQLTRIAEVVGNRLGKHLFRVSTLAANDELEPVEPADIPLEVQRFHQFSSLIYAAAYLAARYSSSQRSDEMLHYITVNAINDGNAMVCGGGHDNAH